MKQVVTIVGFSRATSASASGRCVSKGGIRTGVLEFTEAIAGRNNPGRVVVDDTGSPRYGQPPESGPPTHAAAPVATVRIHEPGTMRDRVARWLGADARLRIIAGSLPPGRDASESDRASGVVLMDLQVQEPEAGSSGVGPERMRTIHVLVVPADFDRDAGADSPFRSPRPEVMTQHVVSRLLRLTATGGVDESPQTTRLSSREVRILAQVATGLSNKQVALASSLSEKTVRNHLSRIFRKLGASNRTEAVMNAIRLGLPIV